MTPTGTQSAQSVAQSAVINAQNLTGQLLGLGAAALVLLLAPGGWKLVALPIGILALLQGKSL